MAGRRAVFVSDIGSGHAHPAWELFSALEVGIERTTAGSSKLQVVYRNLDGVSWDISQSVTSPNIPTDDCTAFDLVKPLETTTGPNIGFEITVDTLEVGGTFSGTFYVEGVGEGRPWRGKSIGTTDVPLSLVDKPPEPLDPAFKTFLAITPLGNDGRGGFVDRAQVGSNELFRDLLLHAMPSTSASFFTPYRGQLGESLWRSLRLRQDPLKLRAPAYFSIQKLLEDNRRFLELASMHQLCHVLKHNPEVDSDCRDAIHDKFDLFWKMLKCSDDELEDYRHGYGSGLPAAREAHNLRAQYVNTMVRCYDIAYLWFAKNLWETAEHENPAHLYDLVKTGLTSDHYINQWLPRTINVSDQAGCLTVEQRLSLLSDKLHLLQAVIGREDPAEIQAIISHLAHAAIISGIASRPLIDTPNATIEFSLGRLSDMARNSPFRGHGLLDVLFIRGNGIMDVAFTYLEYLFETKQVEICLDHDAKDLGLYEKETHWYSPECVVL